MSEQPPKHDPPRTRLESEVMEILERVDRPPSNVVKFRSEVRKSRRDLRSRFAQVSEYADDHLVLFIASVVVATLAVMVQNLSAFLASGLAMLSFGLFLFAYFLGWRSRGSSGSAKKWRGRDIDLRPPRRLR